MSEKEVVKLENSRNLTKDKYMAEAPEKFEELMDDLDEDLNKEDSNQIER